MKKLLMMMAVLVGLATVVSAKDFKMSVAKDFTMSAFAGCGEIDPEVMILGEVTGNTGLPLNDVVVQLINVSNDQVCQNAKVGRGPGTPLDYYFKVRVAMPNDYIIRATAPNYLLYNQYVHFYNPGYPYDFVYNIVLTHV